MKIWKSFSGEHSAKLKIIGRFKTAKDAKDAELLFNELIQIEDRFPSETERSYSKPILDFISKHNFSLDPHDVEYLDLFYPIEANGTTIEVDTDDWGVQPLLYTIIHFGGKVELYSKHNL